MPHILKHKDIEVHIDLPTENYRLSRFDWTGKIVAVTFNGKYVSGVEIDNLPEGQHCGKGFYNEFGIESPVGYEEAEIGQPFHKVGIGLMIREESPYEFHKDYHVVPAEFEYVLGQNSLRISCKSSSVKGFAYYLEKEIKVNDDGFSIHYQLENTGEKSIVTDEYNHNFLSLDRSLIGKEYTLNFPFRLQPEKFGESVNPENCLEIGRNDISFKGTPSEQFFFSNLSGGAWVDAHWKLEHTRHNIGISETGSFPTNKVNLWGWKHVISPELFVHIHIKPGQSQEWTRTYKLYEIF